MKEKIIMIFFVVILISLVVFFINKDKIIKNNEANTEYKIPKLYIIGNIEGMQDKTDKRQVQVKYESNNINFESYAILKVQGASSLKYDKKNYNIIFYENSDYNKKKEINLKWGNFEKYTLKANAIDPMHYRNTVTAQIASQINKKYGILKSSVNYGSTDGFPIEIYENGDFLGLYTLNIHKDYLFDMNENNKNNLVIFGSRPMPLSFVSLENEKWNKYEVEVGEKNQETLDKLNRMIDFVRSSSDEEFVNNFEEYFNKDSVLNYYCYMKFAHLIDNVTKNLMFVTYDGKVWYMIFYDLDYSWGLDYNEENTISDLENEHTAYYIKISPLWKKFKVLFKDEIEERYKELRKDILTKENIINKMNDFYKLIPDETLEKEYEKWNDRPTYDKTYIEDYLDNQITFFDKEFGLID